MALQPTSKRFTVAEYYQMGEAGILDEDDRVELIDGEIIEMSPMGSPHAARVARAQRWLERAAGDSIQVRVQLPVRLGPHSEPVPDLALARPRADFYETEHPTAQDVLLLIEIADTSIRYDRGVKAPLYARSGIAELWIADLKQRTLTVYRDPTPNGYRSLQTLRPGERITVPGLEGVEAAVDDILG